jgi:hypothetical protein
MLRSAVFAVAAVAISFSTAALADNVSESTQIGVQGGAFFNSNTVTQRGVININTNQQLGVVNFATSNQKATLRNRNFNTQLGVIANWGKNVNIVRQESNYVSDYNNYSENYQEGFANINDVTQIEHSWRHHH